MSDLIGNPEDQFSRIKAHLRNEINFSDVHGAMNHSGSRAK